MADCICNSCRRIREFHSKIKGMDEEQIEFFTNLLEEVTTLENDLAYYRGIMDGTWPQSKEIIISKAIDYLKDEIK